MIFKGKTFLVTGGGSGIGQAACLLLAESGADVVAADVNDTGLLETVGMASALSGTVRSIRCDVSREDDVERAVAFALEKSGRLDGACNAAGISHAVMPIHEISLEIWNRCIGINLTGVFLCMKHEIAAMIGGGGGSIVNISSTAAVRGYPGTGEYAASKSGVTGLARTAVADYGKLGIRVNTILPGPTRTPMFVGSMADMPGMEEVLAEKHPRGRFGEPVELGYAIRWLLSDEASYVMGVTLAVDGGDTTV